MKRVYDWNDIPRYRMQEIVGLLRPILGKTLGEIDKNNVFDKTLSSPKITGIAGDVIEQSVFEYKANSNQIPDLCIDGDYSELKTIGVLDKGQGVWEAKEPCSITAVSISSIVEEEFDDSAFWHKAARILFVYYVYTSDKAVTAREYMEFPIKNFYYYVCPPDDRVVLEKDWTKVQDFLRGIREAYPNEEDRKTQYPNLSTVLNRELEYLDTAPKYPNSPRFRFRRRFVTVIVQKSINNTYENTGRHYLGLEDVERECAEYTKRYKGKTVKSLCKTFGIPTDTINKQIIDKLIARMFGGQEAKKISNIEQLAKLGLQGQTVVMTEKGGRTEDMKLSACPLNVDEFKDSGIKFEDTEVYSFFTDYRLLCPIFTEHPKDTPLGPKVNYGENTFEGFKILRLDSEEIMNSLKKVWDEAHELVYEDKLTVSPMYLRDGSLRITPKTGEVMMETNLPKSKDNVIFFRGTGSDANDKITINGLPMYRQNYWIKGSFIVEELKRQPFL